MISLPLLKQTTRSNWKLLLILATVPCLFLTMVTAVFTAETLEAMKGMLAPGVLPEALTKMMSAQMDLTALSLTGILSTQFFGMLAVIFPMIYCIIVGNKLIASQVDRGSMAYILATPTERNQVTRTQALYLVGSLLVMFCLIGTIGIGAAAIFQPGQLNVREFLILDLGAFLLAFAIGSITFFASCFFNLSKNSVALGAGVPLAFFVFNLIASMGDSLKGFKYLTLMTLFDTKAIVKGGAFIPQFAALALIGIALYATGIVVFKKKDLPL